jgi:hypothetical protein
MSIIGQTCEMADVPALDAEQKLAIGDRARFTGDDLRDEGDPCREIVGTIEAISGGHAALRDDDGNLWSVDLGWLERVEDGRAS